MSRQNAAAASRLARRPRWLRAPFPPTHEALPSSQRLHAPRSARGAVSRCAATSLTPCYASLVRRSRPPVHHLALVTPHCIYYPHLGYASAPCVCPFPACGAPADQPYPGPGHGRGGSPRAALPVTRRRLRHALPRCTSKPCAAPPPVLSLPLGQPPCFLFLLQFARTDARRPPTTRLNCRLYHIPPAFAASPSRLRLGLLGSPAGARACTSRVRSACEARVRGPSPPKRRGRAAIYLSTDYDYDGFCPMCMHAPAMTSLSPSFVSPSLSCSPLLVVIAHLSFSVSPPCSV